KDRSVPWAFRALKSFPALTGAANRLPSSIAKPADRLSLSFLEINVRTKKPFSPKQREGFECKMQVRGITRGLKPPEPPRSGTTKPAPQTFLSGGLSISATPEEELGENKRHLGLPAGTLCDSLKAWQLEL